MKRIILLLLVLILGFMAGSFVAYKLLRGDDTPEPAHIISDAYLEKFNSGGERLLQVPGTKNFRDLGGYKTADGRTVKWDMIYRSDNLAHLDSAGMEAFEALNIRTITDLRSEEERIQEPNRIPAAYPGRHYQVLPINDRPVDIRVLGKKIITGKITDEEISDLLDHRKFITTDSHREYWGQWLRDLANDEATPHLFHCTSGKDRTGFGASIFLLTMGVPEEIVKQDFLLSNQVLEEYNDARIIEIEKKVPGSIDEDLFRKILGVSEETIDLSFAEMKSQYGSVDGFIRDGLGIDDETRQRLQDKFLEN
ncbi:MAG: tyrosine-protein phosphatase [Hellea sp.]|nr:tyrosine-protein phosphatase [Hellea sp.]